MSFAHNNRWLSNAHMMCSLKHKCKVTLSFSTPCITNTKYQIKEVFFYQFLKYYSCTVSVNINSTVVLLCTQATSLNPFYTNTCQTDNCSTYPEIAHT